MKTLLLIAAALFCIAAENGTGATEVEEIDLYPPEHVMWTPRNLVAGVTSLFGLYNHWYKEQVVFIETVPADAQVGLYYLRGNFQKRFERVDAPIRVLLPSRINSSSQDTFRVRVTKNGFLVREERFKVHKVPRKLVVELAPLPNSLTFLGHTHLGNRSTLTLRTTEEPQVRMAKGSIPNSFTMAFVETANKLEEPPQVNSGFIKSIEVVQLGEDLVLRVTTTDPKLEVRSRSSRDPVRREHIVSLDIVPPGTRMMTAGDIARQLDRIPYNGGSRCDLAFERVLRSKLDTVVVTRAFRGGAPITEYYQKEAMRKLGRLDKGRVHSTAGEQFRIGSPIEFEMAMQSAQTVKGYLGLLGAIARRQPDPATFMRSVLAPDMLSDDFSGIYDEADRAYRNCR